jgi:3-phosphoshikimate 1-carboxyvinyltransferase
MPPLSAATVRPASRVRGRLNVPGDKSISHRYAMLAALARGRSDLRNFAPGADCRSTLSCLRALDVAVEEGSAGAVTLMGRGLGQLRSPSGRLDCGNSGTTIRLMAGMLAGHPFSTVMIGDESLSRRPMRRVVSPLERMGARIDTTDGHAPVTVHGGELRAIAYMPETPSAQIKSAVLLAGLHADGETSVHEPAATRDHTERALRAFGGTVGVDGLIVSVTRDQRLTGQSLVVPGDFSSAAFWLVAAAALPGSSIEVAGVGLNPTRTALLDVLRRFGARVTVAIDGSTSAHSGEPLGSIAVEADAMRPVSIAPAEVPSLIDELPALAALAAAGGEVTVHGAGELRVKESDRIAALVAGFRALGINAEEHADGFVIAGPARRASRPTGGVADARGDHRMAMAFAVAALAADGPSTIDGADSVGISYPGFFETLDTLVA